MTTTRRMVVPLLATAATLVGAASRAQAQCTEGCTAIHTLVGEAPGDQFGWKSNNIGDVTGDGVNDFVITAPFNNAGGTSAGRIYVYSGADGTEHFRVTGTVPNGAFGRDANRAGDVNNDQVPDVIVGVPQAGAGRATVHSGVDGTLLHTFTGQAGGDEFGYRVSGGLDVDADGTSDLLVSAALHDAAGANAGRAYAYSGVDFSLICTIDGVGVGDQFGTALNGVGDVNGDNRDDFVVGARNAGGGPGRAYVVAYDGVSCGFVHTLAPGGGAMDFGHLFAAGGHDVNGDGTPDIYVGDFPAHRAYVYSGVGGSLLHVLSGDNDGQFGLGEMIPDVNGDGHADLILAAWVSSAGASNAGKAFVYSGGDGAVLETFTHDVAGANFGFDAKGLGDVNDDGKTDYVITAASALSARGVSYVIAGTIVPTIGTMTRCDQVFAAATDGGGGERLSRFGCLDAPMAPAAAGGGNDTAVQVVLSTMYNTSAGHPGTPVACPAAGRTQPALDQFEGHTRWLGSPQVAIDDAVPPQPDYIVVPLVCTPEEAALRDWTVGGLAADFPTANVSRIHFFGPEVVPCSVYSVRFCTDPLDELTCAPATNVLTSRLGDCWPPFSPAAGQPSFTDIAAIVNKYKNIAFVPGATPTGGAPEWYALVRGNVVAGYNLSTVAKANFVDISKTVESYKSIAYNEAGPCDPGTGFDNCGAPCSTAP